MGKLHNRVALNKFQDMIENLVLCFTDANRILQSHRIMELFALERTISGSNPSAIGRDDICH